jgi:hypothetical protein
MRPNSSGRSEKEARSLLIYMVIAFTALVTLLIVS